MSGLLAAGAAVAGVLALAEALTALQAADPLGALARWLAPARAAGRDGAAPGVRERRRLAVVAALVLAAAGRLLGGWPLALGLAAAGPVLAVAVIRGRRRRWRRALAADAAPACRAIADALAGGAGLIAALRIAADDGALGPVARDALGGAACAVAVGAPLEHALDALAERAGPGPWDALVAALLLQRRSGGDLARLLRDLAEHAEAGARAEAEARDASAQARLTARIVLALPVLGGLLAEAAAPGTTAAVLADPVPRLLVGAALVLQVGALVAVRRIARVGDG